MTRTGTAALALLAALLQGCMPAAHLPDAEQTAAARVSALIDSVILQVVPLALDVAWRHVTERYDVHVRPLENGDFLLENSLTESLLIQDGRIARISEMSTDAGTAAIPPR